MGKSNGNGNTPAADPLEAMRGRVAGLQTRARDLEAGRAEMTAKVEALEAGRGDLSARAHVHGDETAKAELKALNLSVLDAADALRGFDVELGKVRAEMAEAEPALADADRLHRIEQADAEAAEAERQISAGLAVVMERWNAFAQARQVLYTAQARRMGALDAKADAMRENGAPPGHAWPAAESMVRIDRMLEQLVATGRVTA